jgi:hypothetical protein
MKPNIVRIDRIDFEIHSNGDVFFQGRKICTKRSTRGYQEVRLALHRLVAHAFHGPPPSKKHVCHHKDRDPGNNEANNLEWITQKDNFHRRSFEHRKKLTDAQIYEIRKLKPKSHETLSQMAKRFKISYPCATAVHDGRTWKNGWYRHNGAKLSADQIQELKNWTRPPISAAMLARKYHVSDALIFDIWNERHRFATGLTSKPSLSASHPVP